MPSRFFALLWSFAWVGCCSSPYTNALVSIPSLSPLPPPVSGFTVDARVRAHTAVFPQTATPGASTYLSRVGLEVVLTGAGAASCCARPSP